MAAATAPEALEGLLTVRLWALLDAFESRLADDLAGLGLTVAAFRLIGEVVREPGGVRQSELARRLRVRPPTVSSAVSKLEAAGLVQRVPDPDDPRARRVCLQANAPLQAGVELLMRIEQDLTSAMSATELERLGRQIEHMQERLTSHQEETG